MGTSLISSVGSQCPFFVGMGFYTSNANFNPSEAWPGTTWSKIENMFIFSDGNKTIGTTGGEETHTLTLQEIPAHMHEAGGASATSPEGVSFSPWIGVFANDTGASGGRYYPLGMSPSGGDQPHNNMPPYIVRRYWERIS